jgi:acetolactate decarboxylase
VLDPHLVRASHGHVHQTDAVTDLLHGNYESVTTVAEVFPNSLLGLGVADRLDGEIVSVDGETWRVPASGIPEIAHNNLGMPFAISAEGGAPIPVAVEQGATVDEISHLIESIVAESNDGNHAIVAVRIDGTFNNILLRSEHKQEPPFEHLDEVLRHETQFPFESWTGTLVGFSFPQVNDQGITIPGLHLHAISADRTSGGHCHSAIVSAATMNIWLDDSDIAIPQTRISHAMKLLEIVRKNGGPEQIERARLLLDHLNSEHATAADFAEAIALHDAYLNDPYLEK